jgi:hypothetical protein
MAKIYEEIVVIKLSKLIKEKDVDAVANSSTGDHMATNDICDALQSVAEELLGAGIIVEVERA